MGGTLTESFHFGGPSMLDDPRYRPPGRTAAALQPGSRRRDFLKLALAAAALGAPPLERLLGSAAAQAAAPFTTTPLRDGLTLIGGAGGNITLLKTPNAAALVDSGAPEHAAALSALVRAQLARRAPRHAAEHALAPRRHGR